jgi:hypothetical protein
MNAVRTQSRNPVTIGIVAFIAGLLIGLVVLGWWLFPVQWTGASPAEMSPQWQQYYLTAVIEAYGYDSNATLAQERYAALGSGGQAALSAIAANPPAELSPDLIASFSNVVMAAPPSTTPTTGGGKKSSAGSTALAVLVPVLCLLLLGLVAFLLYIFLFRKKGGSGAPTPAMQAEAAKKEAGFTDFVATGNEPPVAQFMAAYKLGDDLFDDSFSIDSPAGEFLGECGVGISETIGSGDPKKVTAFEVWLFDKNDIQTVTKVLMSSYAFNESSIRQRLEAKGEPVLVQPGVSASLDTQTLHLDARVVDMGYAEGAMPEDSHFDHLLLEIAIWQKPVQA